ncbi:lipoate--protein ligase family protein [Propionibacteriaceae bacterium G1746]|uniref:lipoate--protein ligase family protein n=1 Tax=Aestuariimicrobium sp. G57 TaxID=3418485 RepID=UPI003C290EE4
MLLLRGRVGDDPALEMAASSALLQRARVGELDAALRIFRPTRMVAFGRRDANRPGFGAAVAACRRAEYVPVVRPTGGRAVATTTSALVIDHVQRGAGDMAHRFTDFGVMLAQVLADFGIDARVGEVPGEFCPGAHSVNARGVAKLVGTAQRVVREAWFFSSVVIIDDSAVIKPLLVEVYDALELAFDPASVGAVRDEAPQVSIDVLEQAFIGAYDDRFGLTEAPVDERLRDEAARLVGDHRVG